VHGETKAARRGECTIREYQTQTVEKHLTVSGASMEL
jgi:hypothetical protein